MSKYAVKVHFGSYEVGVLFSFFLNKNVKRFVNYEGDGILFWPKMKGLKKVYLLFAAKNKISSIIRLYVHLARLRNDRLLYFKMIQEDKAEVRFFLLKVLATFLLF